MAIQVLGNAIRIVKMAATSPHTTARDQSEAAFRGAEGSGVGVDGGVDDGVARNVVIDAVVYIVVVVSMYMVNRGG